MSTFSLLIAFDFPFFSKSYRLPFFALQNVLLPSLYSLNSHSSCTSAITASVTYLVSCISGASLLILYVVTRLLTDGYFQAHCQVVIEVSLPFALSMLFETLSVDLGCFPLNVQHLSAAVGLRLCFLSVYSQFTPDQYTLTCHHWYRALPSSSYKRALLKQLS